MPMSCAPHRSHRTWSGAAPLGGWAAVLLLGLLTTVSVALPANGQGLPEGPVFTVAEADAGPQEGPAVVAGERGEAVYLWFGLCPEFDLCHRLYDATGFPAGDATPLDTGGAPLDAVPAVALGSGGDWVAVWSEPGLGFERRIAGRRYNLQGAPLGDPFIVASASAQVYDRPDLAVAPDGDLIVAFERLRFDGELGDTGVPVYTGVEILARRLSPSGVPRGPVVRVDGATVDEVSAPSIAVGGGEIFVAWESFSGVEQILTRRFADQDAPVALADESPVSPLSSTARRSQPTVAASTQGTFLVSWLDQARVGVRATVQAQILDGTDPVFPVPFSPGIGVSPDSAGGDDVFALTWLGVLPNDSIGVFARRYSASGLPLEGAAQRISEGFNLVDPPSTPAVALFGGAGQDSGSVHGWRELDADLNYSVLGRRFAGAVPPPPPCVDGPRTLCVGVGDRFEVEVVWSLQTEPPAPAGPSGTGQRVELTTDTGYFWFFRESNVEMVVKVLDGCGANGFFWVFAGGLTDVGVEMTVRDSESGAVRSYVNRFGDPFEPIQDTAAFPCVETALTASTVGGGR